ncbi:SCO family protein [Zunongwangia endophytica]|uniref:SCO family protein n=1 Tax=Zunongwangia endophytica TaxID=1808945 RepID=A0ABV8H8M3_9FLAO|nr:SCO family protein [Zunongwangia endophytica]MDN3596286.1 SCO family protein [Zunongwangia endophytica]
MKKKYSYIGVAIVILVFGIIFIPKIIDRVKDGEVVTADRLNKEGTKKVSRNTPEVGFIELNGEKRKAPEFEFIDQNGDTISNEDYLGKVYVVEFFFTTCPTICPVMSENLVEVQNELKSYEDEFGIASFSIDPSHDTPEVLAEYADRYGVSNPNWHLMTGDRDEIYQLANAGFQTYAGEDASVKGGFIHSGMFALIDKDGFIRSRKDKFGNPLIYYRGFVERNKSIAEGEEEPQIDMLIEDIKTLL